MSTRSVLESLAVVEFRITKYDPAFRDETGAYTRDEWTAVGDIGRTFSGVELSESAYQRVEDAYAATAIAFMRESGVASLTISGLENGARLPLPFSEGALLNLRDAAAVLRQVLREEFWCRLEAEGGFIHLGYDYYMYIGVVRPCPEATALARQLGLFVEPFRSPYNDQR